MSKTINTLKKAVATKQNAKRSVAGFTVKTGPKRVVKYKGAFADDNLGTKLLIIKPSQWNVKHAKNGQ